MDNLTLTSYSESARPAYLYEAVRDNLRRRLSRSQPGDRLPSERQLVTEFNVTMITIKRAISELSQEGLVKRCHGRGSFATEKVNSLKKILWVTGIETERAHVSRYWSDCMVFARKQLEALGFTVEQFWGPKDIQNIAVPGGYSGKLADYLGFGFIASSPSHPILRNAIEHSLPHVVIGYGGTQSPSVINNTTQAFELALSHLHKKNYKRISFFTHGSKPAAMTLPMSNRFKFDFIETLGSSGPIELERNSYFTAMRLIAEGKLNPGIFIDDDIVARGVTRAILESRDKVPANLAIVVLCERHSIVPYGLPVTYVTFDAEEQIAAVIQMLTNQINGIPLKEKLITIPFRIDEGELEESLRSESRKSESRKSKVGGQTTDDRRRRTEDRGQRTEDRGQRTEDRGQRTEDREQMTDDRRQTTDDRRWGTASLVSL